MVVEHHYHDSTSVNSPNTYGVVGALTMCTLHADELRRIDETRTETRNFIISKAFSSVKISQFQNPLQEGATRIFPRKDVFA